jgi:hypothetical protein
VADSAITLAGTASDPSGVTQMAGATVHGWLSIVGTTTWSTSVPLSPGSNQITILARDSLGNWSSIPIEIFRVVDTAPTVSILQPSSTGSWTAGSAALGLSGMAADELGLATITWQATGAFTGQGACTTTVASAPPGMHQLAWSTDLGLVHSALVPGQTLITITATDTTGHASTATLAVEVPADAGDPGVGSGSACGSGSATALLLVILAPLGLVRRRRQPIR